MQIKLFKYDKDYKLSVETIKKIKRVSEILEEMTEENYSFPNIHHTINMPEHRHSIKIRKL